MHPDRVRTLHGFLNIIQIVPWKIEAQGIASVASNIMSALPPMDTHALSIFFSYTHLTIWQLSKFFSAYVSGLNSYKVISPTAEMQPHIALYDLNNKWTLLSHTHMQNAINVCSQTYVSSMLTPIHNPVPKDYWSLNAEDKYSR